MNQRTALKAVARRFSATWQPATEDAGAFILRDGARIAVDLVVLRGPSPGESAKPRLRFDKVATRLLDRLQAACEKILPDGRTVLLTITAPIRLASKTAAALEDRIRGLLDRESPDRDEKNTIHGNRVHMRIVSGESRRTPKMIGFVHNPDCDPVLLLDVTSELLELTAAVAGRLPTPAGDRWLLMIAPGESSSLQAYGYIVSQLRMAAVFEKIFIVSGGGRVEILADATGTSPRSGSTTPCSGRPGSPARNTS